MSETVIPFQPDAAFYQNRARKAMQSQDYPAALRHLNRAVRMEPQNAGCAMDLASCYAQMGLYECSNLELQLLLHRSDAPRAVLYGLGRNYMELGDYDQAETMFWAYLKAEPQGQYEAQVRESLEYMAARNFEAERGDGREEQIRACLRIAETEKLPDSVDFPRQLTREMEQCMESLKQLTPLQISDRLREERLTGEHTKRLLRAALFEGSEEQRETALELAFYGACEDMERLLREILLLPVHSVEFKNRVTERLRKSFFQEPYYMVKDGLLDLAYTRYTGLDPRAPGGYRRVMSDAPAHAERVFGTNKASMYVIKVWMTYMMHLKGDYPPMKREFVWIKVLEGMYLESTGVAADWKTLAAECYAGEELLLERKGELERALQSGGTKNA